MRMFRCSFRVYGRTGLLLLVLSFKNELRENVDNWDFTTWDAVLAKYARYRKRSKSMTVQAGTHATCQPATDDLCGGAVPD
jgi:hypothetical protein